MGNNENISLPNDSSLSSSEIRNASGLSYRTMHEWEKRNSLPHQKDENGNRKFNFWEAAALCLIKKIHTDFGTPLQKQKKLLSWALGDTPTNHQFMNISFAENMLYDFENYKTLAINDDMALQEKVDKTAPRMIERGWSSKEANNFAIRFYSLSGSLSESAKFGTDSANEMFELFKMLPKNDQASKIALSTLGTALLPLFEVFIYMSMGYQVFLVTDLDSSTFLTEDALFNLRKQNRLPLTSLIVSMNEHLNRVLEVCGTTPFTITLPESDVETAISETQINVIAKLMREKDFDRLIIESKPDGFRLEIVNDYSDLDLKTVVGMFERNNYQSLTLKRRDGKLIRVTQAVSKII